MDVQTSSDKGCKHMKFYKHPIALISQAEYNGPDFQR
jgi:hypothetical protein